MEVYQASPIKLTVLRGVKRETGPEVVPSSNTKCIQWSSAIFYCQNLGGLENLESCPSNMLRAD